MQTRAAVLAAALMVATTGAARISAVKEFGRLLTHARAQFVKNPNLHAIMIQETNIRGREKIDAYKKVAARA